MPGLEACRQPSSIAEHTAPLLDVSVTYTPMLANVTTSNGFTMQGGSVEVYGHFRRDLGAAADVTEAVVSMLLHLATKKPSA
jgi:hypothetical protein